MTIASITLFISIGAACAGSVERRCDGSFMKVAGEWIALPECQRATAEAAARERGTLSGRASGSELTAEELCRWHGNDIRTTTFCSEYND